MLITRPSGWKKAGSVGLLAGVLALGGAIMPTQSAQAKPPTADGAAAVRTVGGKIGVIGGHPRFRHHRPHFRHHRPHFRSHLGPRYGYDWHPLRSRSRYYYSSPGYYSLGFGFRSGYPSYRYFGGAYGYGYRPYAYHSHGYRPYSSYGYYPYSYYGGYYRP